MKIIDGAQLGVSLLTPQSFTQAVRVALASKENLENEGTEIKFNPVSRGLAATIYSKSMPSVAGVTTQKSDALGVWIVVLTFFLTALPGVAYLYLSRKKTTVIITEDKRN